MTEEVVISGIGGYFPKSVNIEDFYELLLENSSFSNSFCIAGAGSTTVPKPERFDNAYFGIHRQQCLLMDPMQHLVLERTFEALLDAGENPVNVRGKKIGVFVGTSVGESDDIIYKSDANGFGISGHARAMVPNRISYCLNLKGPSVNYDSNWLSGLEVLRMGWESIKEGHCESAIVVTANLLVNQKMTIVYKYAGFLSPEGETKPFDSDANGYGRSDGIVVFFLQRKTKAKRAYASIVNCKTMFSGNRDGPLLDVNFEDMKKFYTDFYSEIDVNPADVSFVEAYGCGIKKIDEAEVNALDQVYCKNRKEALLIGSVKSSAGHSEATSTSFAVVKTILAMESGIIPPNWNYQEPNPNIKALIDGRIRVITEKTPWKGKYAAINGIGLSSSYGHLLLKSNEKPKLPLVENDIPRLFIASTRTEDGIAKILETVRKHAKDTEYAHLIQETFASHIPGHLYRGYTLVGNETKQEFEHYPGKQRPVWFLFSGMGSQWPGMANDIMRLPVIAESIRRSHKVLEKKGIDLIGIITSNDPHIYDNILHSFVGIAAVQISINLALDIIIGEPTVLNRDLLELHKDPLGCEA